MEPAETTPLLSPSPPSPSPSRNPALILTIVTSTLTLLYTLSTSIGIKTSPNAPNLDWATEECADFLFHLSIISLFSLAVNIARLRKDPSGTAVFLAFVVDIGVALFGVAIAGRGFQELSYTPGRRSAVVEVLLMVGFALGLVVGLMHALFVLRGTVDAVRKLRQGYSTWRFPTGQFTVEFTVKILRQEEGRNEAVVSQP